MRVIQIWSLENPAYALIGLAKLTSGASQMILTATLEDYDHPNVQPHYTAVVDGREFQQILNIASIPAGPIRFFAQQRACKSHRLQSVPSATNK